MVIMGGESKDPALHICFVQRPPRKPSPSLLPWVGGLVPCAWMDGGTGGSKLKKLMTDPGVCGGKGMVVMMTEKKHHQVIFLSSSFLPKDF